MSIASEITSMGENLKKDYQSIANLGADLTNVDKNIENIAELLDGVYDVLPKTSFQEGTEVTIENGLKGKIDFDSDNGKKIVGYGDTKQDTTQGINMLDLSNFSVETTINGVKFTPVENGGIKINGTATANATLEFIFSLVLSGNYTMATKLDGTFTNNESPQVILRSGSSNVMYNSSMQQNAIKINTFNNVNSTIDKVRIVAVNGSTYNCIIYPMCLSGIYNADNLPNFEKFTGNSPSPSPSYPQEIEVVTGTQTVYIKDENNNIIDTKTLSLGDIQLNAIGDYKDELIYDVENDKVYKNEKIRKIVLNGTSQVYWKNSNDSNNYLYYTAFEKLGGGALADKLTYKTVSAINGDNSQARVGMAELVNNPRVLYINIGYYMSENTLDNLKAWLQANNITTYCIWETSQEIEITGQTLHAQVKALYNAHSLNGTTIITSNGNLPMIIKVRALKGE